MTDLNLDSDEALTSSHNTVILEGDCNLYLGSCSTPVRILITSRYLKYASISRNSQLQEITVNWQHVIGCHCTRGKRSGDQRAFFCLYAYIPRLKEDGTSVLRHCNVTFEVSENERLKDNMDRAKTFQGAILSCIHQSADVPFQNKKPYLIFINPNAGQGKSYPLFQRAVNPIFGEADIPYQIILTEYQFHARDYMRTVDVTQYAGVIIVSGDGVIHEVINGLFSRPDWKHALENCPIGCIATGSGNALAASIVYAAGLSIDNIVKHSTLVHLAPKVEPMDLVIIELPNGEKRASFLSVSFGIIADIDIKSERLRRLGMLRFTLVGVSLILAKRHYGATISYLPAGPQHRHTMSSVMNPETMTNPDEEVDRLRTISLPADLMSPHDVEQETERTNSLNSENESPTDNSDQECTQDSEAPTETLNDDKEAKSPATVSITPEESANSEKCPPFEFKHCPPMDQPTPKDWVTISGEFISILAMYQTHINTDVQILHSRKFNDDFIYLHLVRRGTSRAQLMKMLTTPDNSSLDNDAFPTQRAEIIPVRAFRLTPDPNVTTGMIVVDGELVPFGPLQAEVLPGAARIMTRASTEKCGTSAKSAASTNGGVGSDES